jgi:hypothetical protein
MKNIIRYIIIRMLSKDVDTALKVYNILYPNNIISENKTSTPKTEEFLSKKDEVLKSLEYLKSKNVKTKKDKESIYMLEMILKNLK